MENDKAFFSRRNVLKSGIALAAQTATGQAQRPAKSDGRKFLALVRYGAGVSVQELTLLPIQPREVLIRTEASVASYSITPYALHTDHYARATILNHSGMGVVEEVGPMVKRVQPGDRVIVAGTPQCGQCYQCLQGRADHCQFLSGVDVHPIAEMADGTPVQPMSGLGGISERMVVAEEYCCPVFTDVPSAELALLADSGGTGLSAAKNLAEVQPGTDVVVLGAGPVGLAAIQSARIMGAGNIIIVEPIRARREVALKVGATMALDPNLEGDKLVAKIRDICKGKTDRLFAGGNLPREGGADFVIEAVGGDQFRPKVEVGPDPTGILPLQQAWQIARPGGHIVTHGIGQRGNVSFPAPAFCISGKTFHAGQQGGLNMMRDLPRYVRLIEKGLFDAKSIITATYPLERAQEAFQAVADRTVVAAVVVFS
jgi:S-(hydroxymethyl)glutathione dehydrogenase/alcohol dehydrogenase